MLTITITAIIKITGYYMILFLAGLQSVSEDLYEAAALDGANSFPEVPLHHMADDHSNCILKHYLMCHQTSFKVFDLVSQMTDGGPANSSNVLVYRIYTEAFKFSKFGYASAYAVILFAIVMVITLIQFRGQKKWVNY